MHPKFFGVLGYDFSEKSLVYGLCAQVIFSGGLSSFLPTFVGFLSGMMCVNWSQHELPEFVYNAAEVFGKPFVDDAPAIMMSRSVQRERGAGRGNNRQRQVNGGRRDGGGAAAAAAAAPPVVQPPRPPVPPPEEAIAQLTSMGFEREAVVRALQQTDNNLEAAANRLLTS